MLRILLNTFILLNRFYIIIIIREMLTSALVHLLRSPKGKFYLGNGAFNHLKL